MGACVAKGGACMAKGGMHGKGGGMRGKGGGMRGMHAPLLRDTAGQCAGGTHPTGMHSCLSFVNCRRSSILIRKRRYLCHLECQVHFEIIPYARFVSILTASYCNGRMKADLTY